MSIFSLQLRAGKRRLSIVLSFFLLFACNLAFSQSRKVKGTVTDNNNQPVVGATVTVKGTGRSTSTDGSGNYSVEAPSDATLVISSIGFEEQEISTSGRNNINTSLSIRVNENDEVVVVGYGTQRKKDLTGSVGIVDVADAKKTATYDVAKMLQGQVAGVTVQGSGEPGAFVQIKIRGVSSFGNNSPLFVIDGVPVGAPFDFNPGDIESIQVLKDASAAAIYGSRAATGVVIITTKKGKAGPLQISYNGYAGVQNVPRRIPVTDAAGYQKITTAAELNANLSIAPGNDPNSPSFIGNVNTDWQKEAFTTGIIQDHNISLSGGNEFATFNSSLGYFKQTSAYTGPQMYDRYTMNTNVQGKKGRFAYGAKVSYTQSHKVNPYNSMQYHAVFGGAVTSVLTAIPTMPVRDPNRLRGWGGSDNATQRAITLNVVGMNSVLQDYTDRNRFFGNAWAEIEILKNLKYKLNLSYDRTDFRNFHFEPTFDLGWYYLNTQAFMYEGTGKGYSKLAENTLTYNLEFGKSRLDLLAGYTSQKDNFRDVWGTATGFQEPYFYTFDAIADPTAKSISDNMGTAALSSYLGRINYNYDDRYLLTVNYRRDGSSRFRSENRWGNFGGIAAAWNVSNESWLNLPEVISNLKIRGGYGTLGNQEPVGFYSYQSFVNPNSSYVFGNTLAPGTTTISVIDPAIKWESKTTSNIGVDMGLFNDRLNISAEYFNNKTEDILVNIPLPLSVGSFPASYTTNAASVKNTGFEVSVTYCDNSSRFKYDVNVNAHTLKNEVISLGGTNNPIYGVGSKTEIGRAVGDIFAFQTAGIFKDAADVAGHAFQVNAAPGDVKFVDQNKDNRITDDDRIYLGSAIPKFYFGANFNASYDNFDFSMFWQGNTGSKVLNGVYHDLIGMQYSNHHTDMLNFWTPTNTNTNVPRPIIGDPNANNRFSDRHVESGSYVKLQNFQLGYTVPAKVLGNVKVIKGIRAYISGQNVVTISNYRGYDPDFMSDGLFSRGFDIGSFPNTRTFMFGVQAKF